MKRKYQLALAGALIGTALGLWTEHGHGQTPDAPDTSICYEPGGIAKWGKVPALLLGTAAKEPGVLARDDGHPATRGDARRGLDFRLGGCYASSSGTRGPARTPQRKGEQGMKNKQEKIDSLMRRMKRLTDDLYRGFPVDQTIDVSGQIATTALLAIEQPLYWKNKPIETLNGGRGMVEVFLCDDDKPDRGFRMSNLPMMRSDSHRSKNFTLDISRMRIPSADYGPATRLQISHGCNIVPSFGLAVPLKKWTKTTAFNVLFPYGKPRMDFLDFFSIKIKADHATIDRIDFPSLPDETDNPKMLLYRVMYEDVLRGVRNALGAHLAIPKPNAKLTPSNLVGWLALRGPWATRIYINTLACHLGIAVGRGMELEIDPVQTELMPLELEDSFPWGILLWGDKTPGIWGSENIVVRSHPGSSKHTVFSLHDKPMSMSKSRVVVVNTI